MAVDPKRLFHPGPGDLFELLNEHGVEYLVLGAQAAILYGVARSSFDIDILLRPTPENAQRLVSALQRIGFGIARDLDPREVFQKPFFTLADQCKIDIFTVVPVCGRRYEECVDRREVIEAAGVKVPCLDIGTLIASKQGTGRPKDAQDILELERIRTLRGTGA